MILKYLLGQHAYWQINKKLAREYGYDAAALLAYLIDGYEYYCSKEEIITIDGNEYFFATIESIEKETALSEYKQRKAFKELEKAGFIKTTYQGLPRKKYFTVLESQVLDFFNLKDSVPSPEKIKGLDPKKLQGINNKDTNNKFTNTYTVSSENSEPDNKKMNKCLLERVQSASYPDGGEGVLPDTPEAAGATTTGTIIGNVEHNDEEKVYSPDLQKVIDKWNTINVCSCRKLTDKIEKAYKKAKKNYSLDEILLSIERYGKDFNSKDTFFNYKWNLETFLKQKNCIPDYQDDGVKWLNCKDKLVEEPSSDNVYKSKFDNF